MAWISQWNFGNDQLEGGDEVTISIHTGNAFKVKECGINIVYEEEVYDEEDNDNHDNNTFFFGNEVIGGDLSNFQLSNGAYFLSRRTFSCPVTSKVDALQKIFKDIADIKVNHWENKSDSGVFVCSNALNKIDGHAHCEKSIRDHNKVQCSLDALADAWHATPVEVKELMVWDKAVEALLAKYLVRPQLTCKDLSEVLQHFPHDREVFEEGLSEVRKGLDLVVIERWFSEQWRAQGAEVVVGVFGEAG
ncbi:hypothetical protein LguiB_021724 [Lonicera macranthoides]